MAAARLLQPQPESYQMLVLLGMLGWLSRLRVWVVGHIPDLMVILQRIQQQIELEIEELHNETQKSNKFIKALYNYVKEVQEELNNSIKNS